MLGIGFTIDGDTQTSLESGRALNFGHGWALARKPRE